MLNKLILFLASANVAVVGYGQARLVAQVNDRADNALPFAQVSVNDGVFGTQADEHGQFTLAGLRPGDAPLRIVLVGYRTLDTVITLVAGDNRMTFALDPDDHLLRDVEVSAIRAGDRAPFARSTVTKAEIRRSNTGVDLPYLLDGQPSTVVTSDGGTGIGYTAMRIRGTDATRTNITLNGVPFNDAESQGAFLVNLPDMATSTEDIEVQRGVGTSTNGPAAFGASINLRTTTVQRQPWGLVGVSGGSYGTQRCTVSAGTGLIGDHFSLDMRLSSITTDGYVDRATADLKSYFVQGAWIGAKSALRFITFRGKEVTYQAWAGVDPAILDTNRTYNPYSYANEVDNYDQAHYQLLIDQRIGASTVLNLTLFRVQGKGYFEQYRPDDDLETYAIAPAIINGDTITTSDIVRRRWLDNSLNGANLSADIKLGEHRLVFGGSASDYRGEHFGELIRARYTGDLHIGDRYYDNDAHKTDLNAFAKFTCAVTPRLDVFGDAQMRSVRYAYLGFNNALDNVSQHIGWTFFNPKAGVLWRVHEGGRAYASCAVGNREPNREDLQQTTPTSRPTNERLLDYELGYERRNGRASAGVNGFFMDYTDQLVNTGELNDVGAALRTNVPKSYRAGLELMFAIRPWKRLLWRANATLSSNKVMDFTEYVDDWSTGVQRRVEHGTTDIAFSPAVIASSELGYRFWDRPARGSVELTLITKYVGRQYLDNTSSTDRMLHPYLVNELRANITWLLKGTKGIDLNLTVRNLFSEMYESNGWAYSYFENDRRKAMIGLFPQAPLNVLGGVSVRF